MATPTARTPFSSFITVIPRGPVFDATAFHITGTSQPKVFQRGQPKPIRCNEQRALQRRPMPLHSHTDSEESLPAIKVSEVADKLSPPDATTGGHVRVRLPTIELIKNPESSRDKWNMLIRTRG